MNLHNGSVTMYKNVFQFYCNAYKQPWSTLWLKIKISYAAGNRLCTKNPIIAPVNHQYAN